MALNGHVALVTGAANGIGLSTARALLQEGARVTLCDVAREKGEEATRVLEAEFEPDRCLFIHTDVTDDAQMEEAFSKTKDHFQRLDIVVNSAAIVNELDWSLAVDVNLKGVMRGTLLGWKHMTMESGGGGGAVVNLSSLLGLQPPTLAPAYSASKHGIVGFSRSAGGAVNFDRTGVRVITVCPGKTDTALFRNPPGPSKEWQQKLEFAMSQFPHQKTSAVASEVVRLVQEAKSGSVWVVEDGQPAWEVTFPTYKDLRAAAT